MYVIFPADEIILLSYGIAIPRLQPRPTLDNLREPLVPFKGIRPPTNSNLDVKATHTKKSSITSNHIRFGPNTNATPRRDPSPNVSFADEFFFNTKNDPEEEFNSETNYSNYKQQDEEDAEAIYTNNNNHTNSNNTISEPISGSKKKSKLKSKITLSLGRIGRPHSREKVEPPSRLREDLQIRVSNPTFTSDNLRQNNYDAFFASGESVYSLERKNKQFIDPEDVSPLTPTTPLSAATTIDTPSSFAVTPSSFAVTPSTPSLSVKSNRKNSLAALFHKSNSKIPSSASSAGDLKNRPNSAELYRNLEVSQKGERCPFTKF